jgi:hypothetical protein
LGTSALICRHTRQHKIASPAKYDHCIQQRTKCDYSPHTRSAMETKCIDGTRAHILILPLELLWKIFELLDYPFPLFMTATYQNIRSSTTARLMIQGTGAIAAVVCVAEKLPQHITDGSSASSTLKAVQRRPTNDNVAWPSSCYFCGGRGIPPFRIRDHKVRWTCQSCRTFDFRSC